MEEEPAAGAEADAEVKPEVGTEAKPEAAAEGCVDGTAQEADEVSHTYSHGSVCSSLVLVDGVYPKRKVQRLPPGPQSDIMRAGFAT